MKSRSKWVLLMILAVVSSCYTFKSTSIDPSIETFTVKSFEVNAPNAQPGVGVTISENLRSRILRETRLNSASGKGDVQFEGIITGYTITPISPQEGETTSQEKLSITVQVTYTNNFNEKDSWEQTFTGFEVFNANANFSSLENDLISSISVQIVDEIFRKAFENW